MTPTRLLVAGLCLAAARGTWTTGLRPQLSTIMSAGAALAVLATFVTAPALLPNSASAQTLRVTSVVPGDIASTGEVKLLVLGTGFDAAIEARLSQTALYYVPPISLDWQSSSSFEVTFRMYNEPAGHWALVVMNPDGAQSSWPVTVSPIPMPSGIQPASAGDGDVLAITVTGLGFYKSRIRLQRSGQGIIPGVGPVTAPNGQSVVADFDLRGAGLGPWDLDVTNGAGGHRNQLFGAFHVVPGPNIASASPESAPDTGPVVLTLQGVRFETGATARLRAAGVPDVAASTVSVAPGGASLEASFDLDGVAAASYDIIVLNPSGIRGVKPAGFEVLRAPRVTAYEPALGEDGALVDIVFDGHGFLPGATVRMTRAGESDLAASAVQVSAGGDALTARFDLRERALGEWDVMVANPNGVSATAGTFEIRAGPRATTNAPGTAEQGSSVEIQVEGGAFVAGATLALERGALSFAATSVQVAPGGGSVSGQLSLAGVDTGAWDIVVRNPDGRAAWIPGGFDVHRLSVTSVTPDQAGDGGAVVVLATGERFRTGAAASLLRDGDVIAGTDAATSADGRLLGVTFDLAGAEHGAWDLAVHNPQGSADTLAGAVTVGAGPPVVSFGLEQAWNNCIGGSGAVNDHTSACDPDSMGRLFATFRVPHDYESFVALDVVMDVIVSGDEVPPFWRFVDGECHANGLDIHDAPPAGDCSGLPTPWGLGGVASDAFITAYAPGHGSRPDRARLLISIVRASSDPVTLIGGQTYYAFHLDLLPAAGACEGCEREVDWHWISATFYSPTGPALVVRNPGLRTKTVTVNGGVTGPTVASVWPERVAAAAAVELEVYGSDFWPGAQAHLARGPGEEIYATRSQVAPNGQTLRATFDLSGRPGGIWDLVVTNPDKTQGRLLKGVQIDAITPTLVLAFGATPVTGGLEIRWRLARGSDWSRTWVERGGTEQGPWRALEGQVTAGDDGFVLDTEPGDDPAWYRLMGDRPGAPSLQLGIIASPDLEPAVTRLEDVSPNPSTGSLSVSFSLERAQPVRVAVLDVQGRVLAILADGVGPAGRQAVRWSGDTPQGRVRPGVYFVEARLGDVATRRRFVIVR